MTAQQLTLNLEIVKPEEWRPIPGFEGRYDVSDLGQVRGWYNRYGRLDNPRVLKPIIGAQGYPVVFLSVNGNSKRISIHTAVLLAFIGPRPYGHTAAHGDGVRANSALSNLRWAAHKENCADKVKHGTELKGEDRYNSKLTQETVNEIRRKHAQGFTQHALALFYGISTTTMHHICRYKRYLG